MDLQRMDKQESVSKILQVHLNVLKLNKLFNYKNKKHKSQKKNKHDF